jgi:hypothetical protein
MYSENNKSEAPTPAEAVVVTFAVLLEAKHFLQHLSLYGERIGC